MSDPDEEWIAWLHERAERAEARVAELEEQTLMLRAMLDEAIAEYIGQGEEPVSLHKSFATLRDRETARGGRPTRAHLGWDVPVLIDIVVARRFVREINDYPTAEAAAQALAREFAEVRRIAMASLEDEKSDG